MSETTTQPGFSTEMVRSNERIEIEPPTPSWGLMGRERTHAEKRADLNAIMADILRHVDDVSQRTVAVLWDSESCCAHCKEPVKLGTYGNGEPACCNEAIAEWVASGGVIAE